MYPFYLSLYAFYQRNMRNILFIFFFSFLLRAVVAQTGDTGYTFLRYPSSARANAMGGNTMSLVERDPSLIFHNPALLGAEMDQMVNLNYLNYISDINVGSALFTKAYKEKGAWGVGASFFSQASLKFLYSGIGDYTSIGMVVDAGLSYYDSEKGFSFGFAFKNIGAQLKAYEDERQKMPWDIQLGITKQMAHAPIRLSLTAQYLTKWKVEYVDDYDREYTGDNFFKSFVKHLVIGVDYIPSDNFWLGIGYNPKTALDMKLQGSNALAGFSGGAGVRIKMFDVGVSVAKYHPSALSMMLSISTTISDF